MVSAEDWALVQGHFDALCDLPRDQQQAALEALELSAALKTELIQLLAFDRPHTGSDPLSAAVVEITRSMDGVNLIGEVIGAYRLTRPLGVGGMGEVYLAERADGAYQAQVAVKFLTTNARRGRFLFERERQVLARLSHPAIAKIFDAGEHPRLGAYLVMEYVEGQAIDQAVEQGSNGPRSSLTRIKWMVDAAEAVAYAHQSLVLHRDLKPDHLLLTADGQLKILDFGVAGLLDEDSDQVDVTGQASFTPRYAAPEQILNQPATTRTDVYALGLILFELMTGGCGAFGDRPDAIAERKLADQRENLPRRADLTRSQQRDLRAIVFRCLARTPEQRYNGPAELAFDLRALLADQPINARPSGWWEAGWRWGRRHRLAGAALIIAGLSVVVGTTQVLRYAHQARLERQVAVLEASKAQATSDFLAGLFSDSTPGQERGPDTTARELLIRGRERIDQEMADQPDTRAHLEVVMARSFMFLGLYEDAMALIEASPEVGDQELLNQRALLKARVLLLKGEYEQLLAYLEALDLEGMSRNDQARVEISRATARINLNDIPGARDAAQRARSLADDSDRGLEMRATAVNMLAVIAYNARDLDLARSGFEDLLATRIQRFGENHAETALAIHNLAGVSYAQGDLPAALDYYTTSSEMFESYFGVENRSFAMVQRALGMTHRKLGNADQSMASFDRSLEVIEAWSGTENSFWREVLMQKIELLILMNDELRAKELLLAFGDLNLQDWQGRQANACRWARMRAALSLPESTARWCADLGPEPDHLRPGQTYLRARIAKLGGGDDYSRLRARALESLDLINPPDPLLEAAILRLQND